MAAKMIFILNRSHRLVGFIIFCHLLILQVEQYDEFGRLDGVAEKLKADLEKGMRTVDVQRSRLVYGRNRLPE